MDQIEELNDFLSHPPSFLNSQQLHRNLIEIMRGDRDVDSSIVVCSNLRRAAATAAIGFQHRFFFFFFFFFFLISFLIS